MVEEIFLSFIFFNLLKIIDIVYFYFTPFKFFIKIPVFKKAVADVSY